VSIANTTDIWSAAGTVFIVVAISGLAVVAAWEHDHRHQEHEALEALIRAENESVRLRLDSAICTGRLNLLAQTLPKGRELWPCMPRNFIEDRRSLPR
jgi:hypothetical protein